MIWHMVTSRTNILSLNVVCPLYHVMTGSQSSSSFVYCTGAVRDSALAEDSSGCSRMSGVLSKKSPHGIWQKRLFCLNNEYLVYRAADADPGGATIKGAVDLADVVAVVASGNSLTLKTTGDRDFALQASSADVASAWAVALEERRRWLARPASADDNAVVEIEKEILEASQ
jgi:hypothetical protein